MECYHCGQENNDNAVYCKNCGQRVDGKIKCPSCKKLIDCDSQFCEYCGFDVQGHDYNDDFEGNLQSEKEEQRFNSHSTLSSNRAFKLMLGNKSVSETCLGLFAMAAIFFSLIFTFFIGIKVNMTSDMDISEIGVLRQDVNIFYYLKDVYTQLDLIAKDAAPFVLSNLYFTAIMGTLLSIAIILTVVSFAIVATVRYVNYSIGKSEKSFSTFAIATYISFILGATLFYAFNSFRYQYATTDVSARLNNFTTAGIAISTIFIVLAAVSKMASIGKLLTTKQNQHKISYSVIAIIALIFIAILTASPSILINANNITCSTNYFGIMAILSILYLGQNSTEIVFPSTDVNEIQYADPPIDIYANLIVCLFLQIAVIVMIIIMIGTLIKNISDNEKQKSFHGLAISIIMFLISLTNIILTSSAENLIVDYSNSVNFSFSILPMALTLIVSVIYMAIEIIHSVINANIKKT